MNPISKALRLWLVPLLIFVLGTVGSWSLSQAFRQDALRAWRAQAEEAARTARVELLEDERAARERRDTQVSELFLQANVAFQNKHYGRAVTVLDEALKHDPLRQDAKELREFSVLGALEAGTDEGEEIHSILDQVRSSLRERGVDEKNFKEVYQEIVKGRIAWKKQKEKNEQTLVESWQSETEKPLFDERTRLGNARST